MKPQKTIFTICILEVLLFILFCAGNLAYSQANSILVDGTFFRRSIRTAYDSLGGVISAPHTIEILASYTGANESFPITLGQKTGSSAVNTITIRPDAAVTKTISSNVGQASIILDGADYIIIDGRSDGIGSTINLTIKNTNDSTTSGIIEMKNGAIKNVVKYVNCYAPGASTSLKGGRNIYISSSTGPRGNDSNTVDHCIVNGGRRGVQTFGSGGNPNRFTTVTNNTIKNQTNIGIFIGNETVDGYIFKNEILNDTIVSMTSFRAINCQGTGDVTISSNNIHSLTSASSVTIDGIITLPQALTLRGSDPTAIHVIDNFVCLTVNNPLLTGLFGIFIASGGTIIDYTANVLHNSIRIGGTSSGISTQSTSLTVSAPDASSEYKSFNNICINERNGGSPSSFHTAGSLDWDGKTGVLQSDYNTYFCPTCSTGVIIKYNADRWFACEEDNGIINALNLDGLELHGIYKNVPFVSTDDLHLVSSQIGGDFNGLKSAFLPIPVSSDIDGDSRSLTNPYRGADELSPLKVLTVRAYFEGVAIPPTRTLVVGPYELRKATPPYLVLTSCKGTLNNISSATICVGGLIPNGMQFYIAVKQFNHLETWSSVTSTFSSGTSSYDFQNMITAAYGSNMAGTSPPFKFYGGDIDGNGGVGSEDLALVDNDAYNFVTGAYIATDVDLNMSVDAIDLAITDNNVFSFVSVRRPSIP